MLRFIRPTKKNWPAHVLGKTGIKYNIEQKEKYKNISATPVKPVATGGGGGGKLERDRSEKRNPNNVTRICSQHNRPEYHRRPIA